MHLAIAQHKSVAASPAEAKSSLYADRPCLYAADDGQLYYDIVSRVKSYASRQQLAVTDAERQDAMVLEFDRVLINTIGTANMRLYQLRIQTPYSRYTKAGVSYQEMMDSFKAREVV